MLVAANKIDALDEPERLARLRAHVESRGLPFFAVSAATGEGVPALLEAVWRRARAACCRRAGAAGGSGRAARTQDPALRRCRTAAEHARRDPRRHARSDPRRPPRDGARRAATRLRCSTILVMPSRIPPHRTQGPAASMFHRFAMASLAVQSCSTPGWCATTSCASDGPSYTALTLERLSRRGLSPARDVLHHRRRRVRGDRNLAPLSRGPRPGALRRHFASGDAGGDGGRAAAGLSDAAAARGVRQRSAAAVDFPGRRAHAGRIVDRHPPAAARRPEHHRPRAAGGRGPHPATPFVRRTPDGEHQQ